MIDSYDITKDIETFIFEAKNFINQNKYISTKEYLQFFNKYDDVYARALDNQSLINKELYEQINNIYNEKEKVLKKRNDKFIKEKLIEYEEYFDNMFKNIDPNIKLDIEQRKAILINEDNFLVVAGAGSGKTTTMAAKVKYLIEKCNFLEKEIAVISFTNKATNEIKEKIQKQFGYKFVNVMTFHQLGLKILKSSGRDIENIIDDGSQYKIISNYIKNDLFKNKRNFEKLIKAFKGRLSFDENYKNFEEFTEYHDNFYKKIQENTDLNEQIEKEEKNRRLYRRSLDGNYFRSKEETDIANYLFKNGIDYKYEKKYNNDEVDYHPDFYINQGELEHFIEHYGISNDIQNSGFGNNHNAYVKNYYLKHKMHNEPYNLNKFIETFSSYNYNTTYINELEKELIKKGYVFIKRTEEEIFEKIKETSQDKYFSQFIDRIVIPFINIFKSKNYNIDDFKMLKEKSKILNILEQVEILEIIYQNYEQTLKEEHKIDFSDMINLAYQIMPKLKEADVHVDYNYIIVDEYQDISMQRYNLIKRLSDLFEAKIMAVGDDWQAIFGFSGATIDLFTDFKKYLDDAQMIAILNTYRNSQELIDLAGEFVQKNTNQIRKNLKSVKHLENPIDISIYDDTDKYKTNQIKAIIIINIIQKIYNENPKSKILIMGRYKNDINDLIETQLFSKDLSDKIVCEQIPEANITYLTVHSSKGLGYDNCILINVSNELHGFPSQIEDEPIIKLINPKIDEGIIFPEERRLFYVALTRTKNKIYILTPKNHISSFIEEIRNYDNVIIKEEQIDVNNPIVTSYKCHRCFSNLVMYKYADSDFWIYKCQNNCGLITTMPKVQEQVDSCPKCGNIVVYRYKNKLKKVYKCLNKACNYTLYKENKI